MKLFESFLKFVEPLWDGITEVTREAVDPERAILRYSKKKLRHVPNLGNHSLSKKKFATENTEEKELFSVLSVSSEAKLTKIGTRPILLTHGYYPLKNFHYGIIAIFQKFNDKNAVIPKTNFNIIDSTITRP